MRPLTLNKILEFYDVPHLFVAKDTLSTNYLCLLYNQNDGYEYLAVQISELRLQSFLSGQLDLLKAYTEPEQDGCLYKVVVKNKNIEAQAQLSEADITPSMLPEAGYYFEPENSADNLAVDTISINIPIKDRSLIADIAKRMGWTTSIFKSASSKIAVL